MNDKTDLMTGRYTSWRPAGLIPTQRCYSVRVAAEIPYHYPGNILTQVLPLPVRSTAKLPASAAWKVISKDFYSNNSKIASKLAC